MADDAVDFDAAETFLKQARNAYEVGDEQRCTAARKLVAVALGLAEGWPPKLKTAHLKEPQ